MSLTTLTPSFAGKASFFSCTWLLSVFCACHVQAHDAEELEWVSRIMDDSQAELPPQPKLPAATVAAAVARRPLERAVPVAAGPTRSPTICALSTEALVPVLGRISKNCIS